MDAQLKQLADASLAVSAAEEAVGSAAYHGARDRLDAVEAELQELRNQWPSLSQAERAVVAPAARAIKERADAAARRIPRLTAVTAVAPEEREGADPDAPPESALVPADGPPRAHSSSEA